MVEGSSNHYANYVPNATEFFPESFLKSAMTGTQSTLHAADLILLPLLNMYGGVWIDVFFRGLDDLCWNKLEDPTNELEVAVFRMTISPEVGMFWNGFITARKSCVAIRHGHDIFLKLWEDRETP
jgi:hypothetical protein